MGAMWDFPGEVGVVSRDLLGYDVEATDGGIGKVDESSSRAGSAFVVVDTGFWIFGKKRMIPAGVIERVDHDDGKVFVGMSKADIRSAPDFTDEDRHVREPYDRYYEGYSRRP